MRIILIYFLFVFSISFSQNTINCEFNRGEDVYPYGIDSGIDALALNNKLYYVGYHYDSLLTKSGISISCYDTIGSLQWCKSYYVNNYDAISPQKILKANENFFYIVGSAYIPGDTIYRNDPFIAKFDFNGDSLFFKIYKDTLDAYFRDVKLFDSDSLTLLCQWYPDDSGYYKYKLYKSDTIGNLSLKYTSFTRPILGASQILKFNDTIYVGGNFSSDTTPYFRARIFIDLFSKSFKFIDSLYPQMVNYHEYFSDMIVFQNRLVISSRVNIGTTSNNWSLVMGYLNSSGSYTFSTLGPIGYVALGNTLNYNDLFLVKFVLDWNGITKNYLYFINKLLAPICYGKLSYPAANFMQLVNISFTKSKKIMSTGILSVPSLSQRHWNLLTQNPGDFLSQNCNYNISTQEISDVSDRFYIYPNPTNNRIYYSEGNGNSTSCKVISIIGKLVKEVQLNSENSIDLTEFQDGMYIIEFYNGNKLEGSAKFIKHSE